LLADGYGRVSCGIITMAFLAAALIGGLISMFY